MRFDARSYWREITAFGFLTILILLFLHPALLPGKVLLPLDVVTQLWAPWRQPNQPVVTHNEVLMDAVNYIYPAKEFMAESVRNGTLPLWNPYEFTGYPFTYNTQAGLFYPLSIFYYILPGATAVDLLIIVQMCLGAWFMFIYLRHIGLKWLAALIGATTFIFNGLMISWLEWQVVHAAIIWLPAQLYFVEKIADKLKSNTASNRLTSLMGEIIGLGILVAIPWLGGHWSWTLYGSMTLALYMAARFKIFQIGWAYVRGKNRNLNGMRLPLTVSAISLSIGMGLSLVQILPAFNYLSQTHRQALSIGDSMRQGLFSRGIVALIPNFFGNPIHDNWWGPTNSNFVETIFYTGVLTLLLSCLVLFLRRDFHSLFFSIWGGTTLLWALGSPAYLVLYILPVFNGIQPSRAAFLVTFSQSVLLALAVDKLMASKIERPKLLLKAIWGLAGLFLLIGAAYFFYYRADVLRTWAYLRPNVTHFLLFFVIALLLVMARIRTLIKPQLFGWLALLLITSDLFLFGFGFNTVSDVTDLYPETTASTFLSQDPELYRITAPAEGWAFLPNTSLVFRIPSLSAYEPGVLQRISNMLGAAEGGDIIRFDRVLLPLSALDSPILDMLNVKYVTTMNDYWTDAPEVDTVQESIEGWSPLPTEQTFSISEAGLQRVDLYFQTTGSPEGRVIVRILSEDNVFEFAHAEMDANIIQNEDWTSFFFEPFPSTWGRTFRLRVEFIGKGGEVAVGESRNDEVARRIYYLPRPGLLFEEGKTRIYLNEGYFPRAMMVPHAQIVANEEEALTAVINNQSQLREVVFLELEGKPMPPQLETAISPNTEVIIDSYDLNAIELSVDLEAPGFLVLSDTYYAGWSAKVDGEKTPIYRANSLLRAIYVPAGMHTITFKFMPLDFVVGGIISLTTLFFCVIGLLVWAGVGNSDKETRNR